MKYEFSGISTEQFNKNDRETKFTETYDGTLIENEPFTVELDSKEVKLHLYIEDTDMSEYDDTKEHIITIGIVPAFESLTEEHQKDILGQFTEEDQEYFKNHTEELLQDCILYGFAITLRSETVTDLRKLKHTINSAIAVRSGVKGLIGFELDRYVNRIGNTGWDFLSDYCEGADSFKLAYNRYESSKS